MKGMTQIWRTRTMLTFPRCRPLRGLSRFQKATPEPEWTIPPNDFPEPEHNWANAYATTYKVPEENKLQRKTYDIGSFIKCVFLQYQMDECHKLLINKVDLSNPEGHQILRNIYEPLPPLGGPPVRRKEFYINKHSESSDREAVRSQMRILSVISVKVFEKYGYNYLREIILRRADYQEFKISEKDFKNLHPNDFEDLFLLNIQEKLNHLPKTDKTSLHTAINMWIRNLVIRNHVGDLQLGIESYQTKINFERPNWNAADYYFKEDYTIIPKPRAVVYKQKRSKKTDEWLKELHKSLVMAWRLGSRSEDDKAEEAKTSSQQSRKDNRSEGSIEVIGKLCLRTNKRYLTTG
ncbi:hypothetical protein Tco_0765110 [Tanacetum coccineum]